MRYIKSIIIGLALFTGTFSYGVCKMDLDIGGKSITGIQTDANIPDSLATPDALSGEPYRYVYIMNSEYGLHRWQQNRFCTGLKDSDFTTDSGDDRFLTLTDISLTTVNAIRDRKIHGDGWIYPRLQDMQDATQQLYGGAKIDKNEFGKYKTIGAPNAISTISRNSNIKYMGYSAGAALPTTVGNSSDLMVMYYIGDSTVLYTDSSSDFRYYYNSSGGYQNENKPAMCMKYTNTKIQIDGVEYPLD